MRPAQWFALAEMGAAILILLLIACLMVWIVRFFNRMIGPATPEKREKLWKRFLRSIGIEFVR